MPMPMPTTLILTMHPVSSTLWALLGYAAWTLALLAAIAVHRTALVLTGQRRANAFSPWGDEVSPFSARLCRAHANCVENLPIFAAVAVFATSTGAHALTDPLAPWFLAARIAQSTVHLASTSSRAVGLRFVFMAMQMGVLTVWVLRLLAAALGLNAP